MGIYPKNKNGKLIHCSLLVKESMMKPYKIRRKLIARKRIYHLFEMAEKMAMDGKMDLAGRYVEIARKIGMKYLVRIPKAYKKRFCKKCNSYLLPGKNCSVRLKKKRIVVSCHNCGNIIRTPFTR
ncbi:MAG: ribonuclease P protein component 4 [Candidatus Thermoplasmatota archaeon]|nr:ribonuclease P protein component 4 [Candidatus Thermoplasmatota archaeon]